MRAAIMRYLGHEISKVLGSIESFNGLIGVS